VDLSEYASLDAVGLRQLIESGQVTAAEVADVARDALDLAHAELNALTLPLFSPALDAEPGGPLAGVPFVIKDSGPFARGVPFALGSRSVRGAVVISGDFEGTEEGRAQLIASLAGDVRAA